MLTGGQTNPGSQVSEEPSDNRRAQAFATFYEIQHDNETSLFVCNDLPILLTAYDQLVGYNSFVDTSKRRHDCNTCQIIREAQSHFFGMSEGYMITVSYVRPQNVVLIHYHFNPFDAIGVQIHSIGEPRLCTPFATKVLLETKS